MNVTITPARLRGVVTPPPSKSQAHRLLIAAALAQGKSTISNLILSQDLEATIRCLEKLGARFSLEGTTMTVTGMGANPMSPRRRMALPHLDCGESGSTLRFLIPVALAVRGGGVFTGRGRLMERPLGPYFELFGQKGISWEQRDGTLTVSGLLTPGEYALPGDVSSQFFTGLLFALPLLEGDSTLMSTTALESGDYLDMTLQAIEAFGVTARREGSIFRIPGRQLYRPETCAVEADWSNAAFWYAAIGLGCQLDIQGLNPLSCQGDMRIAAFYAALRAEELARQAGLSMPLAQAGQPLELDMAPCPDLVPPVAALAALTPGREIRLVNAGRLRLKESDRLSAITQVLGALGAEVAEHPDALTIRGKSSLAGGVTVDSCNDHRIAMMAAVAAIRCRAPVTVAGAQCVAKSYPNFWDDYEALGGRISRS